MADNIGIGFRYGAIKFEENPAVYYAGQTVNGSVIFDLKSPLNFNVLYIQYLGQATVSWVETETEVRHGNRHERDVLYKGHEEYFNNTQTLAGGTGVTQLPESFHSLPFKFQIPFNIPSSFEGEKGGVSYTITATMVNADMTKEELKKEFTVVAPLDLNTGNPSIKAPIILEYEDTYGSCCSCSSGPVEIRIRLPVTGYCPGQAIPVGIEIQNNSSIEITKMIFEILTKELYRSRQPASEYILPEKVLVTAKRGAVMSHSKRNFTYNIVVPDMIVPYLEQCSLIDIGYFFRVTCELSGCNDEIQDEAEICLGLVPLKETLVDEYKHPMSHSLPAGPIPVDNSPGNLTTPPQAGFVGSTNSINRSQTYIAQNYPDQDLPPPYPGLNTSTTSPSPGFAPYPTHNTAQFPVSGQASYQIGFTPGMSPPSVPSYPGAVPNVTAPYTANNLGPGVYPYPPSVPAQSGCVPSAPPACE